jgi:hypothetical protein
MVELYISGKIPQQRFVIYKSKDWQTLVELGYITAEVNNNIATMIYSK